MAGRDEEARPGVARSGQDRQAIPRMRNEPVLPVRSPRATALVRVAFLGSSVYVHQGWREQPRNDCIPRLIEAGRGIVPPAPSPRSPRPAGYERY